MVNTTADVASFDGTTDITPKPNAATVTSAMRLKVVFVDICFLSIVDLRTIRSSARVLNAFSYDMRRYFWGFRQNLGYTKDMRRHFRKPPFEYGLGEMSVLSLPRYI